MRQPLTAVLALLTVAAVAQGPVNLGLKQALDLLQTAD